MLVLNRRVQESIHIGRDIVITVVDVRGSSVRLAIDAPKEISVHRQELYERLLAEEQQGARDSRSRSAPPRQPQPGTSAGQIDNRGDAQSDINPRAKQECR